MRRWAMSPGNVALHVEHNFKTIGKKQIHHFYSCMSEMFAACSECWTEENYFKFWDFCLFDTFSFFFPYFLVFLAFDLPF